MPSTVKLKYFIQKNKLKKRIKNIFMLKYRIIKIILSLTIIENNKNFKIKSL